MTELSGVQSQVFRPLPDVLRAEAIADRLRTAITLGLLRQGEQLPVENQLTAMFGVATATVRDALQSLREEGIIETRRGRSGGTFIIATPQSDPDSLRHRVLTLSMAELRDLEDEHVANGTAAARLAIERADPADFDRLEGIARQMSTAESTSARVRADSRFHIELAVLAQSERIMATTLRLLTEYIESLWAILDGRDDHLAAMEDHLAIVDAVRRGDVAASHQAIVDHVTRNTYRLIAWRLDELYPDGASS